MNKNIRLIHNQLQSDDHVIVTYKTHSPTFLSIHWHNFFELEIVTKGSGEVSCNTKKYPIKPGMVSLLTPLDFHEYSITSETDIINIQFFADTLHEEVQSFLSKLKENVIYVLTEFLAPVITLCKLLDENRYHGTTGELYASSILDAILFSFKNEFKTTSLDNKRSSITIQKALTYINSNFKNNPRMSDVANYLFINESYFSDLFKKKMGESYKNYVKKLKLNYASNLIVHTQLPISAIASESGYNSPSHFNKEFKEMFGISPVAMRNEYDKTDKE